MSSISRFGDGKLGLVYGKSTEDHRRPNIIRGSSGSGKSNGMSSIIGRNKGVAVSSSASLLGPNHRQAVIGHQIDEGNMSSFEAGGFIIHTSDGSELDGDLSNHYYITDDVHQLVEPSEIPPNQTQEHGQLVQASIETEDGNYIMLIRDDEIVSLQSQAEADGSNGVEGFEETAEFVLSSDSDSRTFIENGTNLGEIGEGDEEVLTAVQNLEATTSPESDDIYIEHEHIVDGAVSMSEDSSRLNAMMSTNGTGIQNEEEQYVMVQLEDGNSYLIPASSLEESGIVTESMFVNENGEQVVQFIDTQPEVSSSNTLLFPSSMNSSSVPNKYRKKESPRETLRTIKQPTRKTHMTYANGNPKRTPAPRTFSNVSQGYGYSTLCTQKPLSSSIQPVPTNGTTKPKPRPTEEELKPRPFRFDVPEEELETVDASSDYLSLVIEKFQNHVQKSKH